MAPQLLEARYGLQLGRSVRRTAGWAYCVATRTACYIDFVNINMHNIFDCFIDGVMGDHTTMQVQQSSGVAICQRVLKRVVNTLNVQERERTFIYHLQTHQ